MSEPATVLIIGAVAFQLPIGVLIYFDARRLALKNPETYWLGVLVPAAGFIVIVYYFSERKHLPTMKSDDP